MGNDKFKSKYRTKLLQKLRFKTIYKKMTEFLSGSSVVVDGGVTAEDTAGNTKE